jgi:hypothetical protein
MSYCLDCTPYAAAIGLAYLFAPRRNASIVLLVGVMQIVSIAAYYSVEVFILYPGHGQN